MNKIILSLLTIGSLASCTSQKSATAKDTVVYVNAKPVEHYDVFGEAFVPKNVLSKEAMMTKYSNLKEGDTIQNVQFATTINSVCKKKGCWMNLALSDANKEANVRFKDYGFFVPLDADGREAIVHGKAYLEKVSVEKLRHYAEDAGKSKEEIAKIKQPEIKFQFMADGVLIEK
ncbi:DUF4920 domain-containing protein [Vaginella massiliensis]|uniref:DUF4920 domain-containing protein n=1 Tax=Vaginella massiliensis TaxID=1816680 RepID=UPI0008395F90|nr:DUF4920 domain-containing protein [Vaginella massiliensis]